MPEDAHFENLEPSASIDGATGQGADLRRLRDVLVELTVEIGRTQMTVGETLELRPGSVVTLERMAGEPVDLLVNGRRIARGEVVVVDEEFGLRVTEIGTSAGEGFTAGLGSAVASELAAPAPSPPEQAAPAAPAAEGAAAAQAA
jgi:flagellar motor switch protein FliN/FliY